jgi:hypothetical protein
VAVEVPLRRAEGDHFHGCRSEEEDKRTKKSRSKALQGGLLRRHAGERKTRSRAGKAEYWVALPGTLPPGCLSAAVGKNPARRAAHHRERGPSLREGAQAPPASRHDRAGLAASSRERAAARPRDLAGLVASSRERAVRQEGGRPRNPAGLAASSRERAAARPRNPAGLAASSREPAAARPRDPAGLAASSRVRAVRQVGGRPRNPAGLVASSRERAAARPRGPAGLAARAAVKPVASLDGPAGLAARAAVKPAASLGGLAGLAARAAVKPAADLPGRARPLVEGLLAAGQRSSPRRLPQASPGHRANRRRVRPPRLLERPSQELRPRGRGRKNR